MKLQHSFLKVFSVLVLVSLALSACMVRSTNQQQSLKVAVLPVIDSLPMYVALQEGYFEKYDLAVELVPVGSAPERDQLVAAGQVDGMINELLSTIMNNRDETAVQVVRYGRAATTETSLFSILSSQQSGITTLDGLKGKKIGISEGTVIAYLTDRLLELEGFTADEIQTVAVPKIPDRMALLGNGELTAAMMPEPLSTLLALQGAQIVLDDTSHPEISYSTIAFRKAALDEKPQAVMHFLAAIEDAVTAINEDPGKYEQVLIDNNILPPPLHGNFEVPRIITAGVPTQAQFDDVLAWAQEQGMLEKDVPYTSCVNDDFLPK
jgi:NitT/TauT family transport system substrate-binding protein